MNKVNLLPLSSIERLAMTQSTSSLPAKWKWTLFSCSIKTWIGSLSNDEGNINKNGQKTTGLDWQNNNSTCASCFFVDFFAITARLRRENVIFSWQSCSDGTEMYKKMRCTCKVVILLGQAIAFLTFSLSLQSLTLIADDNNTARYQSNLQFIDSQMHWFIFINQLQNVFQGSKPILPLSIQSAVHLIEVFNNRN